MNEKKAKLFKTTISSVKMVATAGNSKSLLLTSVWFVTSALFSITSLFEKYFYNSAEKLIKDGGNAPFAAGLKWLGIWAAVSLFPMAIGFITDKVSREMWDKTSYYIGERFMSKVAKIRVFYFDNMETYNKLSMTKNNMSSNISNIVSSSFNMIFAFISLATAAAVIVFDNWLIAVIVLIGSVPPIVLNNMRTNEQFWNDLWFSYEARMQDYIMRVILQHKFLKEIRFGNLYPHLRKRYEESVINLFNIRQKAAFKYFFGSAAANIISYSTIFAALALIAHDIYMGKAGIGSFMLVYSCTQKIQGDFIKIFNNYISITSKGRVVEYYNEIMQYEEETVKEYKGAEPSGRHDSLYDKAQKHTGLINANTVSNDMSDRTADRDIEFKHVTFMYPDTDRIILDDISVRIKHGEKIAIIGENGSGKSTFISLLCGVYKPTQGELLFGGKNIHEDLQSLRNAVSCAFQNFGEYEMSVADNIRIGDLTREVSDDEIIKVAKLSGAYDFIKDFKEGIHTHLGRLQKGGIGNLSGGQWQKVAIARVLLKKAADILILDEPTAALDPIAESKLYENFSRMTVGKTAILISHRLGATRLADKVLVFDKGTIVEQGSHQELMALNGLYTRMYRAQSQWYLDSTVVS